MQLVGSQPFHGSTLDVVFGGTGPDIVDASRLRFARPLDLAALAVLVNFCAAAGRCPEMIVPEDFDACCYLERMNLFDEVERIGGAVRGWRPSLRRQDRHDVLVEVTAVSDLTAAPAVAERFGDLVERHVGLSAASAAVKALGELLDNALTHAGAPVPAYVAAQTYRGARRLDIAVADAGVGILAHLRRNPAYAATVRTSAAIELALQPGVSGTADRRGHGLSDLLNDAAQFGGRFFVRSMDAIGSVRLARGAGAGVDRRQFFDASPATPGTWASLTLQLK